MIRRAALLSLFLPCLLWLAACSTPRVTDYASLQPPLDLFAWFSGHTRGYGQVQERDGTLIRRFVVDIEGTVAGDTLTLDERFVYDDGERQRRVWTIRRVAPGEYRGTADDVSGEARGSVSGAALHWRYTLLLPARGRTWAIHFDDWMYLQDSRVLVNRAHFSKWGIGLGEVTLFFVKDPGQPLSPAAALAAGHEET